MKIYFVRHALTEHRIDGKYQTFDVPLSRKGILQAEQAAKKLEHLSFNKIVSSDSKRAHETALILSNKLGMPVETNPFFREKMTPTSVRGKDKTDPKVVEIMDKVWASWGEDIHHEDEENLPDLIKRACNAITYLENLDAESVLVVTHGTFLRMMLMQMLLGTSYDATHFHAAQEFFFPHNTGITTCEFKNSTWKLLTWNDHAHLGDDLV